MEEIDDGGVDVDQSTVEAFEGLKASMNDAVERHMPDVIKHQLATRSVPLNKNMEAPAKLFANCRSRWTI